MGMIMGMVRAFIDLYKENMKRKQFANYFLLVMTKDPSAVEATSVCTDRKDSEQHKLVQSD